MTQLPGRVLFGAAYYHEYQPTPRLATDLDLMREAGFSVIRVGESVWSTWEPENGVFELDWLRPVLDGAHERGIAVVLGTPTYAVPPWLQRAHPEINAERRTGQPMGWGIRQEIDHTHPAFLFHAERIIRRIVGHYAAHPAVIGYQVDNEPGNELLHNRGVFQRFVDQLRHTYGTVDELNRAWGLTYWSHRLSTWADLWTPDANGQPQYDLAWRRFQGELTTAFIGWQAEVVRELARPDQFVTTCLAYARPAVHDQRLTERLDITAGNPYYAMRDALALPDTRTARQGWTTSGVWALYRSADRMYASRREPFLVTETNAQAIGPSWTNEPAWDGQWRQAAWALVSRGARMIEYWHWHTLHYGTETYWGGVLPHSLEPGRVYRELARIGAEFERVGELVAGLTPDAEVAMVYSTDARWALEDHPMLPLPDGSGGDRESYHAVFDALYRGAFDAGLGVAIQHAERLAEEDPVELAARHPLLVAAGLLVADDALLRRLERYAAAGGHLVLGVRTGYGDEEARARLERKPAHLDGAAGAWYDEIATLDGPLPVRAAPGSGLDLPADATATRWVDGLLPTDAEVLARYAHPHFGRFAAVTTRAHGAGRITTLGTVPDPALAAAVLRWCAGLPGGSGGDAGWRPAAPSQTVTGATAADGTRLRFVHNWSWEPTEFTVPVGVREVTGEGAELAAGERLALGPWDVRVLAERMG
ncbi:beta-galactosidase [Streptomyces sp. 3MP-14]|uniref:beta-galactosidase n=1 Tax=Streptomyces mimosae TaxID=2586635 RepID=A0A5N6A059_9ACTN|nr:MULTISPECIES: beta-galactosidase [Streptomyces]KAB8161409.1 beta-galactosidase [Streptomyces mimosae]KAB8173267.1 beta-galactosidase [Streptomyces sp. 3MP-14]